MQPQPVAGRDRQVALREGLLRHAEAGPQRRDVPILTGDAGVERGLFVSRQRRLQRREGYRAERGLGLLDGGPGVR